jgi:hypothetical protein
MSFERRDRHVRTRKLAASATRLPRRSRIHPNNKGRRIDVVNQRLGYLVRSGDPDALDSIVPMAFDLARSDSKEEFGRLVSVHKGFYDSVPITSVTSEESRQIESTTQIGCGHLRVRWGAVVYYDER